MSRSASCDPAIFSVKMAAPTYYAVAGEHGIAIAEMID
jgi:hypothetical protein